MSVLQFTYNPSLDNDLSKVRFLIQDTESTTARLDDGEIAWALSTEANVYMAAAACADVLALRQRGATSKTVGGLSLTYDKEFWTKLATSLRMRGQANYAIPTAGGISITDRDAIWADTDNIRPKFFDRVLQDPQQMSPLSTTETADEDDV